MRSYRPNIVFLCGSRDYHAMDWYRLAKKLYPKDNISIVTDLIAGESFLPLIQPTDKVYRLLIIDKFLLPTQSNIGNIWRNLVKLVVLPYQTYLLLKFHKSHAHSIYYAHSMYYLILAMLAGIPYIGRPQGSDILIKPFANPLFKLIAYKALTKANAVIVDSSKMKESIIKHCKKPVNIYVIPNGIDISSIQRSIDINNQATRSGILSIRGITNLYRSITLIKARNKSPILGSVSIKFAYPYLNENYFQKFSVLLQSRDLVLGRLNKQSLYTQMISSVLVVSIPSSDSSPRSVFEAILCGAPVAITYQSYYNTLTPCMKKRVILVDISNPYWLDEAYASAQLILQTPYLPSEEALYNFSQDQSYHSMHDILMTI